MLSVTSFRIASTRGANRIPGSGEATFSDGRTYGWFRHPLTGGILFSGARQMPGGWDRFSFHAPKRAAALEAALS